MVPATIVHYIAPLPVSFLYVFRLKYISSRGTKVATIIFRFLLLFRQSYKNLKLPQHCRCLIHVLVCHSSLIFLWLAAANQKVERITNSRMGRVYLFDWTQLLINFEGFLFISLTTSSINLRLNHQDIITDA